MVAGATVIAPKVGATFLTTWVVVLVPVLALVLTALAIVALVVVAIGVLVLLLLDRR